jgi:adenosylcobinamide amidohydrolase
MTRSSFGDHTIFTTENHIHVALNPAAWVLSSAVLGGGYMKADHIVNLKVAKNPAGRRSGFEPPGKTIARYCDQIGLAGSVVGMMTGASMNSFRFATLRRKGVEVMCLVTAGVSNAGRAGDPAEWRQFEDPRCNTGTINIIILTNAHLTKGALVEAIVTVTEAKTVALHKAGITSRSTGAPASGTGTDAIAVVNGSGPVKIRYCGKHVLFGEMLASAVIEALTASLHQSEI